MRRRAPKPPLMVEMDSGESKEPRSRYRLTREERETICTKTDADDVWIVYTGNVALMRKLDKWAKVVDEFRMNGEVVAKEYEVPKSSVAIRKPRKVSEAMRQRGLKLALEGVSTPSPEAPVLPS